MPFLMNPFLSGSQPFIDVLTALGLLTSLNVCVDAGDLSSYASGQQWSDTSGGGNHFNRGTGSGSDAADPTFNGTPGGLSAGEHWSFDGGDYFTSAGSPTYAEPWHKNNATWTVACWVYPGSIGAVQCLFATVGTLSNAVGVRFQIAASGNAQVQVRNTSGAMSIPGSSYTGLSAATWQMAWVSINEASGTGGAIGVNDGFGTFDPTYSSPSSNAPQSAPRIGVNSSTGDPMSSGSRIAGVMGWSRALSTAELDSVYQATRGRFGV
jgi:hypothetical protein